MAGAKSSNNQVPEHLQVVKHTRGKSGFLDLIKQKQGLFVSDHFESPCKTFEEGVNTFY